MSQNDSKLPTPPAPKPCAECGETGGHADWCNDAIDTELVEEREASGP